MSAASAAPIILSMTDSDAETTLAPPSPARPTVVLLHGLATDRSLWTPQIAAWSLAFRVIRLDLPGHGLSPTLASHPTVDDFAACVRMTLDEVGVERAAVVGLSLGGMVAQSFAISHPERTAALVLAHTGARTTAAVHELWEGRIAALHEHGMAGQIEGTLARWFTPNFAGRSPMTLGWIGELIRKTSVHGYEAAIRAIQTLDLLNEIPRIVAPTLVVGGDKDAALPLTISQGLAEAIPGARFERLDAAHLGNVEQPVAFTEIVGRFLQDVFARDRADGERT